MNPATRKQEHNAVEPMLYMALELSATTWKLTFGDGAKHRQGSVPAGDMGKLREALAQVKQRFGLPAATRVVSCYEAGRDGFWLHRQLRNMGIDNDVVDSSSIEVNRRKRRAKTDRIDGEHLLTKLMRYHAGERGGWSVVRVPSVAEENARRLHGEFERLKHERASQQCPPQGLLVTQGIRAKVDAGFGRRLEALKLWDGSALPAGLKGELVREHERLKLLEDQIKALEAQRRERLRAPSRPAERQVVQLMRLGAIGPASAWLFVMEFFGWRVLRNRREVAALAGLAGTPYNSGEAEQDQGISKAGNRRVRAMAVEIAWLWLRYQPHSALAQWYQRRFAGGGKRMRRVGIVALARRILVALWRYLEHGVLPDGARLIASRG